MTVYTKVYQLPIIIKTLTLFVSNSTSSFNNKNDQKYFTLL